MKTTEIVAKIKAGTAQISPEEALLKKLATGKKLVIKLGMDPTAPDLHLGHAVVLRKMKEFQELGHDVVFLIGDFTARIGDPTGKSKTRPPLTEDEIAYNMQTYLDQVDTMIDVDRATVAYNSAWLNQLNASDFLKLCAKVTLARIIEREDFDNRIQKNQPISFHELLYPLLQGYDSVALKADIELGGTDQTFNLLMGRFLQEQYGQEPQLIITMPLLIGLDGVHKMSKSLGNIIGLLEPAEDAFGKLMSISDELMWHYLSVLLRKSDAEIDALKKAVENGSLHPMQLKKDMAFEVVKTFWSADGAQKGLAVFESVIQRKDYRQAQELPLDPSLFGQPIWIVELIKKVSSLQSSSEIRRLLDAGAVAIDEQLITDFKAMVTPVKGMIVKVGKHQIYKLV